jgi:acyl-CoA synthetase (AMP-forming)/AMP-acid ligase II
MHISMLLNKAVNLWPDKVAIVCGNENFTYRQFHDRVTKLAGYLLSHGLKTDDRVAILHHNCHRYLEAYFAAAYAGLILVPVNYRLSNKELCFILKDSGAKVIFSSVSFKDNIRDVLLHYRDSIQVKTIIWSGVYETDNMDITGYSSISYEKVMKQSMKSDLPNNFAADPQAPAHLYYTSGTTGKPKGVILTHKNVVSHTEGTITEFQLNESDVWGHIAPMYHLADAWASFAITLAGGRHVMVPAFNPKIVLELINKEGITISNLIPTMLNQLVNEPDARENSYPSLRFMLSGGAPIAPELVRKVIETFGCEYVQTYGMTETSPYLTVSILKDRLRKLPVDERFQYQSRTGRKFITVDLKVVRPDGSEILPDDTEVGEIWVRGSSVFSSYWRRPVETKDAFTDGWFKTGDLAVIDSEGYVNIVDRKKDIIVTGGENVYSTEVEHVLYEHPAVFETAVIGVPDEQWGEAVKAIVVLKNRLTVEEGELLRFCNKRLTSFKVPKSVDFVPELPKTGTGKIFKKQLKDKYWVGYDKRVH